VTLPVAQFQPPNCYANVPPSFAPGTGLWLWPRIDPESRGGHQ
jgi:hypothetical protein